MTDEPKHTILIVDDEPVSLSVLNDSLGGAGFRTLLAEDGETALKRVTHARPDIILLDVMLPGIDGFETCRRLKNNEKTRDIPVLFMTALTDVVDKVKGFKAGAVDFITKPIHIEEVIARIDTHLTINNLKKKLEEQNAQLLQEIAERKRAAEELKTALDEREVLLREIHHRVKNNLQTISSLLSLQSKYVEDKQALDVFKNCRERVHAMALVHEKLYRSGDLSKVDFQKYVRNLAAHLLSSYSLRPGQVQLKMKIEDIALDIEKAIPLGLIINELVTNSLKHAFPGNRKGDIRLNLELNESDTYDFKLIVGDNGAGIPGDMDLKKNGSLGMLLVYTLVKQLHGVIDVERKKGTTFTIKLNN